MTYVKAIQSYDTQIEKLEIKSEKTVALSFASIVMMVLLAIVHHSIGFDQYVTMLIRLCLEFYFIVIGYALLLLTIYQGILEICRDFLLAKELFIRVTRRYGVKKGVSSLIKKCAERCTNKSRPITPNTLPHTIKLTPEKGKRAVSSTVSNNDKLVIAKEWLWPLARDIGKIENPTHQDIENRILKGFPDFNGVPDEIDLRFIKGENNLNKKNIDIALRYLFMKKHDISIKRKTIQKRFTKYGWW